MSGALDILLTTFPDQWRPKGVPDKNDLRCTSETITSCHRKQLTMKADECCQCHATPIWEGREEQLPMEYVSALGNAIVLHEEDVNISKVYKIEYPNEELSEIPINICNDGHYSDRTLNNIITSAHDLANITAFWPRIVRIDLSNNRLLQISDLNCLTALDTLDLSSNRIEHLSNTSFTNLTHLRVLSLHHNRIQSMDISIIAAKSMHLSHIDLSENELENLDITNFISENPFCSLDYSRNEIQELTNVLNISLNTSKHYESGVVSLQGNLFHIFPDFKELLNLNSIEQLGTVLDLGFDFRDTTIGCDCVLEPYMEKAKNFVKTYWRDYFDVKCDSPPRLKGMSVINVTLDDFVCDLKPNKGCPPGCSCLDIPSKGTLFVDCVNNGLTKFPELPVSKYSHNINLNLSGNKITHIGNVSYLDKITNLDLSQNQLEEINEKAAKALENANIDLSGNSRLVSLPQAIQYRNMCSIHMNNLILDCGCDSKWMENWMDVKSCHKSNDFLCRVEEHGVMPAKDFSVDMLNCFTKDLFLVTVSAAVASFIITLVISATLLFQFRYEVLVILLKFRQKNANAIRPVFNYDAYLSFDTENEDLQKWVYMTLIRHLEAKGYKIFLPPRDLPFGEVRTTATINVLQSTRTFVLILSESYLNQEDQVWTNNEWKYGWNMYKKDPQKNIVLINYDHVSSFDVNHPQIKAFLRVGSQIEFVNVQRNILEQISEKLGPKSVLKGHMNNKTVITPVNLFQVKDTAENFENKNNINYGGKNEKGDNFSNKNIYNLNNGGKDDEGNNFSDTNSDTCAGSEFEISEQNHQVSKTFRDRLSITSDGNIKIKEMKRPVHGLHHYWV
ncbi:protein toll-like [Mercenaria mercenaria]|uniref:protein toll-like n=1 Tax=Mercenaria mercenaria TaxID=6596 RepID=UPI00234F9EAA|nr:protein toll-like [Mercenaria mercenaria]